MTSERQALADKINAALATPTTPDDSGVHSGMRLVVDELRNPARPLADVAALSHRILQWHRPPERLAITLARLTSDIRDLAAEA